MTGPCSDHHRAQLHILGQYDGEGGGSLASVTIGCSHFYIAKYETVVFLDLNTVEVADVELACLV